MNEFPLNRRDFLAASAAAIAAAALSNTSAVAADEKLKLRKAVKLSMVGGKDPLLAKFKMLKEIGGVAGDVVEMQDRAFTVNGRQIGRAKETSVTGRPLEPGPVGIIEPGYLFVFGRSMDSYDSRYAEIGWVSMSQVIGRGHRLF